MAYFNNQMADLIRDCSKSRPTTFTEITFPISQEIENKIRNKNINLRKKARARLQERQKNPKSQQITKEEAMGSRRDVGSSDKAPFNYLELYEPVTIAKEGNFTSPQPELGRLNHRDEEATLQIYLLLRKRKPIFKIEEVKRKLRAKEISRRTNYAECQCCGHLGAKHKCQHIICNKQCEYFLKRKEEEINSPQQPEFTSQEEREAIAIAQQLIQAKDLPGEEVKSVQIIFKEEEMRIPEIDVIDDDINKKEEVFDEEESQNQNELEGVVETERISEVESKSSISESKRHRSDHKELKKGYEKDLERIEKDEDKQEEIVAQIEEDRGEDEMKEQKIVAEVEKDEVKEKIILQIENGKKKDEKVDEQIEQEEPIFPENMFFKGS